MGGETTAIIPLITIIDITYLPVTAVWLNETTLIHNKEVIGGEGKWRTKTLISKTDLICPPSNFPLNEGDDIFPKSITGRLRKIKYYKGDGSTIPPTMK
ncbi:MAG: hypothetical protein JW984_10005 [Deltaproteobacteria bacterium]|uniref:Uncharacterized protein n=1 Tax=Candidatus Zymogenus saltonus TaxID=2844893 RepID=A0A9D8PQ74_9DELT|nr:hypothetical protein [Candidatus Zymogenus saltonus]